MLSAVRMDDVAREQERLSALDRYDVLDTPPEEAFDRITRLVRNIFEVPISAVTLIDGHRQWFKSRQGLDVAETDLAPSLCHRVVLQGAPLIVENAPTDIRVQKNPCVACDPGIRFYAGIPLRTPDGHDLGALCAADTKPRNFSPRDLEILSDLARLVMSELELRTLATTDGLTGALSRRAFKDEAGRAVALALRHKHALSCIALDLDHFKVINDTHGHAVGDLVLSNTVATCREKLRETDLLGRMGGEEFAILLPHTDRAAAMDVAEKLRQAIAEQNISCSSGPLAVSASFGVASVERSAMDIDAVLQHADLALYAAKADGRNRCVEWRPLESVSPNLRRRVFKAGQISFNGGRSTIDCTVRSLSDTGAGMDVISSAGVPDAFKLRIEADDLSKACRVMSKRDKHVEVEFVQASSGGMSRAA